MKTYLVGVTRVQNALAEIEAETPSKAKNLIASQVVYTPDKVKYYQDFSMPTLLLNDKIEVVEKPNT